MATDLQIENFQSISKKLDAVGDEYKILNSSVQDAIDLYSDVSVENIAIADTLRIGALGQAGKIQSDLTSIKGEIGKADLTGESRSFLSSSADQTSGITNTTVKFLESSRKEALGTLNGAQNTTLDSVATQAARNQSLPPVGLVTQPVQPRGINLGINEGLGKKILDQKRKPSVQVNFSGSKDYRARLMIPKFFLSQIKNHPQIQRMGGIIFPYTPSIEYTHSATYNARNLLHTNFTRYFYRNSSVSPIRLSAKFTVQNDREAEIYFSTMYVLKALTRMRTAPRNSDNNPLVPEYSDPNAGNMPPVCRFYAYGGFLFSNIPVIVSSYQLELPDNVNYYEYSKRITPLGVEFVPSRSTINLELKIVYSKEELGNYSLTDFVPGRSIGQGYL